MPAPTRRCPRSCRAGAQFLEVCHADRPLSRTTSGAARPLASAASRDFGVNAVWLELSLTAIDLLAWTRVLLLDGELATAEPKKLRHRLLHVAARLTRGGRRLHLRISANGVALGHLA
ncbi:transposase [Streptomyces sp. NBC_00178]|uniref:transposase n=1 Tax=Streptomyces sp. NBC_00178 TaxID=2975672 RepID=UPI003FA688D4